MMRNLVTSLIEHERIKTTLARAKELRRVADRVITYAKKGDASSRRQAKKIVTTRAEMVKLFTILRERFADRAGGYSRVRRTYPRMGDQAEMAYVEYLDRERSSLRMPMPLAEQSTSTNPGRGGRAYKLGNFKGGTRGRMRHLKQEVRP